MVSQIYPSELKANVCDTKAMFLNCICPFLMVLFLPKFMLNVTILILKLSIFHFLDCDVSRSTTYGVYIYSEEKV